MKHRQHQCFDISGPFRVHHIYSYTAHDFPEAPGESRSLKGTEGPEYYTQDGSMVIRQLIDSIRQKLREWEQLLEKFNEVDKRCHFLDAQSKRHVS